jgi:hypothetical protein
MIFGEQAIHVEPAFADLERPGCHRNLERVDVIDDACAAENVARGGPQSPIDNNDQFVNRRRATPSLPTPAKSSSGLCEFSKKSAPMVGSSFDLRDVKDAAQPEPQVFVSRIPGSLRVVG